MIKYKNTGIKKGEHTVMAVMKMQSYEIPYKCHLWASVPRLPLIKINILNNTRTLKFVAEADMTHYFTVCVFIEV